MTHQEELDQLRTFLGHRMIQARRIQTSIDEIQQRLVDLGEGVAPEITVGSMDSFDLRLKALEMKVYAPSWWEKMLVWIRSLLKRRSDG